MKILLETKKIRLYSMSVNGITVCSTDIKKLNKFEKMIENKEELILDNEEGCTTYNIIE